jgi:hypothetical protein
MVFQSAYLYLLIFSNSLCKLAVYYRLALLSLFLLLLSKAGLIGGSLSPNTLGYSADSFVQQHYNLRRGPLAFSRPHKTTQEEIYERKESQGNEERW